MLAMMDLSKALGYAFQYDHDDVWKTLHDIVAKANARGIAIAANMRYTYTTHEEMRDRVKRLSDHGVRICLMQGAVREHQRLIGDIRDVTAHV